MNSQEYQGSRVQIIPSETPSADRWSMFVGGDTIVEEGFDDQPFGASLRRRMRNADLTVVNVEGAIEGSGEPLTKTGAIKETAERTPAVLADAGVDAVTLANNHAMDLGADGLFETKSALEDAGIGVCGADSDAAAALKPHREIIAESSIEVALFGVCEREFGVAEANDPGTAWVNHPDALRRVETASDEADVTVLFPHGGIEYVPFPPIDRRRGIHRFVDAGADVIVGHHPHVAQGWECVDSSPVFYSLGNFLFKQSKRPNTREGLALEFTFQGDTPVAFELVPVTFADGKVREMTDGDRADEFLRHVHRLGKLTAEELEPHWQEVADCVFLQRYASWLRETGGGDSVKRLFNPGDHLRKGGLWDPERREAELLILLNLVRNESHRAVIETALELRTGIATDRRTPASIERTRSLLERTEDRPINDPPSKSRLRVEALLDRIAGGIPGVPERSADDA